MYITWVKLAISPLQGRRPKLQLSALFQLLFLIHRISFPVPIWSRKTATKTTKILLAILRQVHVHMHHNKWRTFARARPYLCASSKFYTWIKSTHLCIYDTTYYITYLLTNMYHIMGNFRMTLFTKISKIIGHFRKYIFVNGTYETVIKA